MDMMHKADILIQALPYIQKFNQKKVVVKYGGSAMQDPRLQMSIIEDVALLKLVGMQPIIVHGGGKEISRWAGLLGTQPQFVEGLRVTDAQTMEVAEMVLNRVNKYLVQLLSQIGMRAAGICGKDGGMLQVEKKLVSGRDIGYVGEITKVDATLIDTLLEKGFIPVIAPIGMDSQFVPYNINADDAACAIAKQLHAEKLAFLTDIEGVCSDPGDISTLISVLPVSKAEECIQKGFIGGGMLPKLKNCIDAVREGVSKVHILDGRQEHSLLLEFFTDEGIGTAIVND